MITFFQTLFSLIIEFFSKKELPPIIPNVAPTLPDAPIAPNIPVEVAPKYLWDTKENARHSVRLICGEAGLDLKQKDLICQVIHCESGFSIHAKKVNTNAQGHAVSTDYGICQMNSYWYIGANRPIKSIDEAINNPEKCVRVMIQRFKEGGLKDWVCYSSGLCFNYSA